MNIKASAALKSNKQPKKPPVRILPAAMIGVIAGIDNIVAALAMGAL